MTRWSPDTCSCIVEYDDKLNVTAVINKCPKHSATKSDADHLATVFAHNRRKNAALGAVVEFCKKNGLPTDGVGAHYDAHDNLIVVGSSLPTDQIASIIAAPVTQAE